MDWFCLHSIYIVGYEIYNGAILGCGQVKFKQDAIFVCDLNICAPGFPGVFHCQPPVGIL